MALNPVPDHPWIEESYCGPLSISAFLYKNKWKATIGLIFGNYTMRFFILRLDKKTFSYYDDTLCKNGHDYPLEVLI